MVELLVTLAIATAAYAVWVQMVWIAYRWFSMWVWWHSYRLDAWIERLMDVPPELRRFS